MKIYKLLWVGIDVIRFRVTEDAVLYIWSKLNTHLYEYLIMHMHVSTLHLWLLKVFMYNFYDYFHL